MRGRKPKPGALIELQGNPGKRPVPVEPEPQAPAPADAGELSFVKLSGHAEIAFNIIKAELERTNVIRPSDVPALQRYCFLLAKFWAVSADLEARGETQMVPLQNGKGKMERSRPQVMRQVILARLLEALEDRFALSPRSRQEHLRAMSQSGVQLPLLPKPSAGEDDDEEDPPPARPGSPIGLLKHGLN